MPTYVVRCGIMRLLHVMQSRLAYAVGCRIVARTVRGVEVGDVLCEADPSAVSQIVDPPTGSILRAASPEDESELAHLRGMAHADGETCLRIIQELQLPMDLVEVERILGGERIVIYYLSENRVDFRELVHRFALEFQTRIEMRQIGVRDEAKLLADYGDCGKPVCCNTFLVQMPPVSMKMAKLQKATLDPNKISGRCGRLKCCLRYEYDTYEEYRKSLPAIGSDIVTLEGRGRVLNQEILSRQVLVQMEDNRRILVRFDNILSVIRRSGSSSPKVDATVDEEE